MATSANHAQHTAHTLDHTQPPSQPASVHDVREGLVGLGKNGHLSCGLAGHEAGVWPSGLCEGEAAQGGLQAGSEGRGRRRWARGREDGGDRAAAALLWVTEGLPQLDSAEGCLCCLQEMNPFQSPCRMPPGCCPKVECICVSSHTNTPWTSLHMR